MTPGEIRRDGPDDGRRLCDGRQLGFKPRGRRVQRSRGPALAPDVHEVHPRAIPRIDRRVRATEQGRHEGTDEMDAVRALVGLDLAPEKLPGGTCDLGARGPGDTASRRPLPRTARLGRLLGRFRRHPRLPVPPRALDLPDDARTADVRGTQSLLLRGPRAATRPVRAARRLPGHSGRALPWIRRLRGHVSRRRTGRPVPAVSRVAVDGPSTGGAARVGGEDPARRGVLRLLRRSPGSTRPLGTARAAGAVRRVGPCCRAARPVDGPLPPGWGTRAVRDRCDRRRRPGRRRGLLGRSLVRSGAGRRSPRRIARGRRGHAGSPCLRGHHARAFPGAIRRPHGSLGLSGPDDSGGLCCTGLLSLSEPLRVRHRAALAAAARPLHVPRAVRQTGAALAGRRALSAEGPHPGRPLPDRVQPQLPSGRRGAHDDVPAAEVAPRAPRRL